KEREREREREREQETGGEREREKKKHREKKREREQERGREREREQETEGEGWGEFLCRGQALLITKSPVVMAMLCNLQQITGPGLGSGAVPIATSVAFWQWGAECGLAV